MPLRKKIYTVGAKVPFEDVDYFGVFHHAAYLRYFEQARSEWFHALGFSLVELKADEFQFTIPTVDLAFLKPLRLDDAFKMHIEVEKLGGASLQLLQTITNPQDDLITRAHIKLVGIDLNGKPRAFPEDLKEELKTW